MMLRDTIYCGREGLKKKRQKKSKKVLTIAAVFGILTERSAARQDPKKN